MAHGVAKAANLSVFQNSSAAKASGKGRTENRELSFAASTGAPKNLAATGEVPLREACPLVRRSFAPGFQGFQALHSECLFPESVQQGSASEAKESYQ